MNYSQGPLQQLLRTGGMPGESGVPKYVETVLSHIYMFAERVYKLYKNDNAFVNKSFGDLSLREKRFAFSQTDFEWNRQLTPEVYLELQGVRVKEGKIVCEADTTVADELLVVTKRLQESDMLLTHLLSSSLHLRDYEEIGRQFAQRTKDFRCPGSVPGWTVAENMQSRLDDVIKWVSDVEEMLPAAERRQYQALLEGLIQTVYLFDSTPVSLAFDVHCLNAFYSDGVLYPFDVVASKESFRFAAAPVSAYRLATDVFAFVGENEFNAVLQAYYKELGQASPTGDEHRFLVIYASLIMVPYLYMLGRTDNSKRVAAEKYHSFLRRFAGVGA